MLNFKTFLIEYLTDGQRKKYSDVKMTPQARQDTDHFFGKNNDHVREDVLGLEHDKSEVHKAVERHLGKEIPTHEYVKGITKDKHGRDVKLGRQIRDENLRNQFANDNVRAGSKSTSGHYMTVVRGTEVAGQTNSAPDALHPKGHSWGEESCKNVDTGSNRSYLHHEIKHGTIVVRAHDHTGQEIYRATLQPHHNIENQTAYALDSEYGLKHPSFTAHAHDVARRLSGEYKGTKPDSATFIKHDDVYNDNGDRQILHPALKNTDLHRIADAAMRAKGFNEIQTMSLVAKHHAADEKLLTKVMNHPNARVQAAGLSNPHATAEHIHNGLDSDNFNVKLAAAKHPNLREDHVDRIVDDGDDELIHHASKHDAFKDHHIQRVLEKGNKYSIIDVVHNAKRFSGEHINHVLKHHKDNGRIIAVVARHRMATPEHIDKILDMGHSHANEMAASNPNASEANLRKAIATPDSNPFAHVIRHAAILNPRAPAHFLHEMSVHKNADFRVAAAENTSASHDHLHRALNDDDADVRSAAAENPSAKEDHIRKALGDANVDVRRAAARNSNITKELLHKALNDPSERVRVSASYNVNHDKFNPTKKTDSSL